MSQDLDNLRNKLAKSPENLLFRFSYAQKLYDAGNESEAIEQLEICIHGRKDWMFAYLLKAKLEISNDRTSDAVASLNKTIELAKAQSHDDPLSEATQLLESLV